MRLPSPWWSLAGRMNPLRPANARSCGVDWVVINVSRWVDNPSIATICSDKGNVELISLSLNGENSYIAAWRTLSSPQSLAQGRPPATSTATITNYELSSDKKCPAHENTRALKGQEQHPLFISLLMRSPFNTQAPCSNGYSGAIGFPTSAITWKDCACHPSELAYVPQHDWHIVCKGWQRV